tara:strand:+ start:338 stop:574 length:237 start_codon:yes stop_codon:yes gene_type:complete
MSDITHVIKCAIMATIGVVLAGALISLVSKELQEEKDYCMYVVSGQLEAYKPALNCKNILSAKDMVQALEYKREISND